MNLLAGLSTLGNLWWLHLAWSIAGPVACVVLGYLLARHRTARTLRQLRVELDDTRRVLASVSARDAHLYRDAYQQGLADAERIRVHHLALLPAYLRVRAIARRTEPTEPPV